MKTENRERLKQFAWDFARNHSKWVAIGVALCQVLELLLGI